MTSASFDLNKRVNSWSKSSSLAWLHLNAYVCFLSVFAYISCCDMYSSLSSNCSMPTRLRMVSLSLPSVYGCTWSVLKIIARPSK